MIEQVDNRRLYQVTVTSNYKRAFVAAIDIGAEQNPFFMFYETPLEFPITDSQTGALANVNAAQKAPSFQTLSRFEQKVTELAWLLGQLIRKG